MELDKAEKLFGLHPNWIQMKWILISGLIWPLEDLDKELQRADLKESIAFGNHNGTKTQHNVLKQHEE